MQCARVITESMPSMGNEFVVTPLFMQYPIYKHHTLGPMARKLDAWKSDIGLAWVY